jgi:phenylacetate-coenzyme A ligase PaaK-like adenylate-forming protein
LQLPSTPQARTPSEPTLLLRHAVGQSPSNAYACTEAPPTATGPLDHVGMHVWESEVLLEVVDDDGRHVPAGEPGSKVLLTNLVNRVQPLIRYELSDSLTLERGPDPSGRPWVRIARVDGRSDDILRLPGVAGGEVAVHPFRLRAPFVRLPDVDAIERERDHAGKLKLVVSEVP